MNSVFLLLAFLAQDDSARAYALLEETAAKLKAAPALSFERSSTQLSANSKEPYGQNLSRLILRRPNQMRLDSAAKDGDSVTLLDGTNLWQLDRQKNEYLKYPQRGGMGDYWLREDPLNALYFGATAAKILEGAREVRIRSEKEGETAYDVITWKAALPREQAKTADLTLWLGPDRVPRRFIEQYERRDTVYTNASEYSKVDLAPKLTKDTFAFTPPPGATLFDPKESRRQQIPTTEEAKKAQKILEAVQAAFRPVEAVRYEMATQDGQPGAHQSLTTLKRPNLLRMTSGKSETDATSLMICDGSDIWLIDPTSRHYSKYAMELGPTQHLGDTDPLASIFFETGIPLVLCEARDVTVGKADLEGAECDVIGWKQRQGSVYQQKVKLWIGPDRRPRQMTTEWSGQGRSGSETTKYRSFDLSPAVPDGHFAFKPGADWRDITNEAPGAKHLAIGTVAPDFEAPDRGGAKIRLSELRGKPVVLVFGSFAYSGEPDRAQEFHDDFGPRGVIVLAVATGKKQSYYDPKKHTFRLVRLVDDTVAAAYGADLWASLYLIGADGKVVVATISNDELKTAVAQVTKLQASPAGGTPEARETLKRAADTLKHATAVGYPITWHLKDSGGFTRFECRVLLKRPNLVRLEGAFRNDGERDDAAIFVLDGKTEWGSYLKDKKYSSAPQLAAGLAGPYEDPVRLFFFDTPLARWMELAEDLRQTSDRLNGKLCSIVEWRVRYTSDVRYRLWIDGAAAVRRLERTVGGQPYLIAEYGTVEQNPKFGEEPFRFEPPKDATRLDWRGDFEKKLIALGAEAPDFEAKDLEGQKVKLSGWRGKPVLFITWSFP